MHPEEIGHTCGWPGTVIRRQNSIGGCPKLGGQDGFQGSFRLQDPCCYNLGQTQPGASLVQASPQGVLLTHHAHSDLQGPYHNGQLGFIMSRLIFVEWYYLESIVFLQTF